MERVEKAFSNISESLIKLPGAFGELLNEHLTRDSFVCFQGPEKCGKTWLLYWIALQGLLQRKNVAIFQIGDMTESQSIIRLSVILAGKSNKKKYCGAFEKPVGFQGVGRNNITGMPTGYGIKYESVNIEEPLCAKEAHQIYEETCNKYNIHNHLRLFTMPADTVSFTDIDSELDRLEKQEEWIADIVVVDYMDLARCEERADSERAGINKIWKKAKSLNNKRHILLISATQADAETYTGELQTRQNYSEDKRKYSHVNVMIGMSQTDEEKQLGLMKFNTLVSREGEYITTTACFVLQCLRTGEPVVDSLFSQQQITNNDNNNRNRNRTNTTNRENSRVRPRRNVRRN